MQAAGDSLSHLRQATPSIAYPSTEPKSFFFNDTATTEIYTLSLHDALPISTPSQFPRAQGRADRSVHQSRLLSITATARSVRWRTLLNFSYANRSYVVLHSAQYPPTHSTT